MGYRKQQAKKNAYIRRWTLSLPDGYLYVGSEDWFAWLEENDAFYVENTGYEWAVATYTARKEWRSGTAHWYAYSRVAGKLHKRYMGQTDALTYEKIVRTAADMPTTKITVKPSVYPTVYKTE